MGGEMDFEHNIKHPITDLSLYAAIIEDIKSCLANDSSKAFTIVDNPLAAWKESGKLEDHRSQKSSDDADYAFGIDIEKSPRSSNSTGYFLLFPKNPNAHHVISSLHCRGMACGYSLLAMQLRKLGKAFPKTFSVDCDDDSMFFDYDDYSEPDPQPDYTACSADDCGYCGKCDY